MFIHFFERETEYEWGGSEREADTESEADSTEPDMGLKPTKYEIMT